MFDPVLMRALAPPLDALGQRLAARGWRANTVTWMGFAFGCAAALAITAGWYGWGLAGIVVNRLFDGLDGAVARATRRTDFGGYLDIVLDFIFYGLVTAAFAVADPARAVAAPMLLARINCTAASNLAYAIIAARRGIDEQQERSKSFFFAWGLAEGGETIAFLVAVCLWPGAFSALAILFAVLCWITAAQRIAAAAARFT
jgi:phosphatidylglycerophosphate synthase